MKLHYTVISRTLTSHIAVMEHIKSLREAIFISHANPEDNAFTIWLGARLAAAGYEVWADVLKLHGGCDWQRRVEEALRSKARKVLLVGTERGVQRQGVRNELEIARQISKDIDDENFVIPLRLEEFDAPFSVVHAQHIEFKQSWADGLAELLDTLDQVYHVPRSCDSSAEVTDYWKQVHLRHSQSLAPESESLISNWVPFGGMPKKLFLYNFRERALPEVLIQQVRSMNWPTFLFRNGFLTFCSHQDIQDYFGSNCPFRLAGEIKTEQYLDEGWREKRIKKFDAHNQFSSLTRQATENMLASRTLSSYEMANNQKAWWGNISSVPRGQIKFSWDGGPSGRRQIVGYSAVRDLHWHYGVTPKPMVFPFPHVRFISRVIFSSDGHSPIESPKRMHRLRRSFAKSWRNDKWRDMLMAFLYWLAEGRESVTVPVGSDTTFSLHLPPISFSAPISIVETDSDQEEEGSNNDLSNDDEADFYKFSGDEELIENDD